MRAFSKVAAVATLVLSVSCHRVMDSDIIAEHADFDINSVKDKNAPFEKTFFFNGKKMNRLVTYADSSPVTTYEYDENGGYTETMYWNLGVGNGFIIHPHNDSKIDNSLRKRKYDEKGRLLTEFGWSWEDDFYDSWQIRFGHEGFYIYEPSSFTIYRCYTYNDHDDVMTADYTVVGNDGMPHDIVTYEYEYNESGKKTHVIKNSHREWEWGFTDEFTTIEVWYEYDDNDNLIHTKIHSNAFYSPYSGEEFWSYYDTGKVKSYLGTRQDGFHGEEKYDEMGNMIYSKYDGCETIYSYDYDAKNRIIYEKAIRGEDVVENWYKYKNGEKIYSKHKYKYKNYHRAGEIEYWYNKKGEEIYSKHKREGYYDDVEYYTVHTYDKKGRILQSVRYKVEPIPIEPTAEELAQMFGQYEK